MRILFVADGRSPTALNWLRFWTETGNTVHLVSSFPCEKPAGVERFFVLPVAFSGLARGRKNNLTGGSAQSEFVRYLRDPLRRLRYILGPLSLPFYWTQFRAIVDGIKPEIVHALRIPFEGMMATATPSDIPLVVSTWGNDLTLHARGSFLMAKMTRQTLARVDGLIADTRRDAVLGGEWGLRTGKPVLIVPGSGGIRRNEITVDTVAVPLPQELPDAPIVVNPRGQRPGSLRQDNFFQAIPLVLQQISQAVFICPSLKGDPEAEHLVETLGIRERTWLWPRLSQEQLWSLFMKSDIYVSPSLHDGTPNSLLETMACGCFPVVGDIESMREWVKDGDNGSLIDATDVHSIAEAIIKAINQPAMRTKAAGLNASLIAGRADYGVNMKRVEEFYQLLVQQHM